MRPKECRCSLKGFSGSQIEGPNLEGTQHLFNELKSEPEKKNMTATDVTGFYAFFRPEIGQFSPHFGAISLLNSTVNLEKGETNPLDKREGKNPLEKTPKTPVETATRNCRFQQWALRRFQQGILLEGCRGIPIQLQGVYHGPWKLLHKDCKPTKQRLNWGEKEVNKKVKKRLKTETKGIKLREMTSGQNSNHRLETTVYIPSVNEFAAEMIT